MSANAEVREALAVALDFCQSRALLRRHRVPSGLEISLAS